MPAHLLLGGSAATPQPEQPPTAGNGVELLLRKPWTGSVPAHLVFGGNEHDEQPPVDPGEHSYALSVSGVVTVGLRRSVQLHAMQRVQLAAGVVRRLSGSVQLGWSVNVSRPRTAQAHELAQHAAPRRASTMAAWQQAQRMQANVQQIWQDARKVSAQVQQLWQQAQRLACSEQELVQDAAAVRAGVAQQYQDGQRLRSGMQDVQQDAAPVRADALQGFQQAVRLRGQLRSRMQQGQPLAALLLARMGQGMPLRVGMHGRYQEAIKLGPGMWLPPLPPKPAPCYVPSLPAQLLFRHAYTGSAALVFCCCTDDTPTPEPSAQYRIPVLRIYMQVHTLTAHLLPSMEPVQLLDATISTNDDSFCWSLSASGPEHLMEQLAPADGLPARLQVSIDGIPFVFAVMSTPRSRAFAKHRVKVEGLSVTTLLADPYMPCQVWTPTAAMTAQQLAMQALEFTGVGLDWQITDWQVPAGAFSFQGTPLQAVQRVAASVNAVVRSHRTAEQLIIAPRYPVLPWEWADATPDVHMPPDVIVTDDLKPEPRAEYNAVYVTGGPVGGVQGHVVRALSARDKLAPQIQDDLITHADAARMRGSWELAASGNKLLHTINMPVLTGGTNPGVLQPGQLLEVPDLDGTWRGLVRSVSVSAALPKVRQQVTVERVSA